MSHRLSAALLATAICGPIDARPLAQTRSLAADRPIAADIEGPAPHDYQTDVRAGRTLHIVLEQKGVDLVLSLLDPAGTELLAIDSPNGTDGPEAIWFIPTTAGSYGIRVRTFDGNARGRYELRVDAPRVPTADDRRNADAQIASVRADVLVWAGGAANRQSAVELLQRSAVAARRADDATQAAALNGRLLALDVQAMLDGLGISSRGGGVRLFYSRGLERRATALRERLTLAMDHFAARLGVRPTTYLAVLGSKDWQLASGVPYGVPWSNSSNAAIVCMPATHDVFDAFVVAMRKRGLPSEALAEKLRASGLSLEEATRRAADALMYHELGHNLAVAYGIGAPNRWFNEFLANYFMYAYQVETRSDPLAPLYDEVRREWVANLTPAHTSLDDLERQYLGVGIENYGWYQARIEERAAEVFNAQGLTFAARARDLFPLAGTRRLPVAELLDRLEQIGPGWNAWSQRLSANAPRR
jgi:hypothetical protein